MRTWFSNFGTGSGEVAGFLSFRRGSNSSGGGGADASRHRKPPPSSTGSPEEVVLIDLTKYQRRPIWPRISPFCSIRSAGVLEIYHLMTRVKSNHVGVSMSLSIRGNRETPMRNIGRIMRSLNIGTVIPGRLPDGPQQVEAEISHLPATRPARAGYSQGLPEAVPVARQCFPGAGVSPCLGLVAVEREMRGR